jgi:hypothetical protein
MYDLRMLCNSILEGGGVGGRGGQPSERINKPCDTGLSILRLLYQILQVWKLMLKRFISLECCIQISYKGHLVCLCGSGTVLFVLFSSCGAVRRFIGHWICANGTVKNLVCANGTVKHLVCANGTFKGDFVYVNRVQG